MTGAELRELRKELDMTQVQLADEIGVTSTAVALWERGERSISEPMAKLVRFLVLHRKCSIKGCTGIMTRIGSPPAVRKKKDGTGFEHRYKCPVCGHIEWKIRV